MPRLTLPGHWRGASRGGLLACLVVLVGVASFGARSAAADSVLAPVGNDSALSAYGGWVVWSETTSSGRWRLVGWHDGAKVQFRLPTRQAAFDADVGPDASGRPVIVYSRCWQDPGNLDSAGTYMTPNGLSQWAKASDCRLHQFDPATGVDTRLRVHGERAGSDSTPSRWFGTIAFARRPARSTVAHLMLWKPGTRTLRRLPGGDVPRSCPFIGGCKGALYQGDVQQLDLGARYLAFLWEIEAPAVIGAGPGWELFAEHRRDGQRTLVASGDISGTCGAWYPGSPNAAGARVWFTNVIWDCDTTSTSLVRATPATGELRGADTATLAWQMTHDAEGFYTIDGPAPQGNDAPCEGTGAPCALRLTQLPPALGTVRRPAPPF
ncbi:MAG TPA: hypothetical protein VMT10_14115 [Solirubrobacteraceae bacterium]|nr:hypothetical protein [Solirubrobacteraceae bacterium]